MMVDADQRRKDLATIHLGAKALGLDDATYRDMLWAVARVRSAKDLNFEGRRAVIAHLRGCGFKAEAPKKPTRGRPTPAPDRIKMVGKIRAMLYDAGRTHEYADGLAKKMFHVERYEWLLPEQMRRVIASLCYDRGRRAARAMREAESAADGRR